MPTVDFTVIRLDPRESNCIICNVYIRDCHKGVPMYEGMILHNDYEGEWAGFDACDECYLLQCSLTAPVSRTQFLKMKSISVTNVWSQPCPSL